MKKMLLLLCLQTLSTATSALAGQAVIPFFQVHQPPTITSTVYTDIHIVNTAGATQRATVALYKTDGGPLVNQRILLSCNNIPHVERLTDSSGELSADLLAHGFCEFIIIGETSNNGGATFTANPAIGYGVIRGEMLSYPKIGYLIASGAVRDGDYINANTWNMNQSIPINGGLPF